MLYVYNLISVFSKLTQVKKRSCRTITTCLERRTTFQDFSRIWSGQAPGFAVETIAPVSIVVTMVTLWLYKALPFHFNFHPGFSSSRDTPDWSPPTSKLQVPFITNIAPSPYISNSISNCLFKLKSSNASPLLLLPFPLILVSN